MQTANITFVGFGEILVRVRDGAGNNAAGATVTINSAEGKTQSASSGTDGVAFFPKVLAGAVPVSARDPLTGLSGNATGDGCFGLASRDRCFTPASRGDQRLHIIADSASTSG